MRFMFKTDYEDDIRLFPHSGYVVSYGALLALLAIAPFVLSSYIVSQLVFVCIYATVGVGLMILTGFTGQASLGHAAFLAIGAYTAAYLQQFNVPFPVYFIAAGLLTGVIGALVGFPALRLQGIYLVIATISFALIVEEILARWESVTHGNEGMRVKTIQFLGTPVPRDSPAFYFLCLGVLILTIVGTLNLLRSPTGRAFVAIRDSETAARSMGINVSLYKVKSFAISAAITGFAGCLFAHKLSFISPEMFTLQLSIEFIIVILIGGAFSLHGAVLGAIFIVMIDPFLTFLKDDVPGLVAGIAATLGAGARARGAYSGPCRRIRLRQRPEGRDLRHHHRAVRPVRAAWPLRALAQDQTLLPALPALQAGDLQAAEDLREIGAEPVSYFRAENLSLHFGGLKAVDAVNFAVEKGEILSIIGPNGAGKSSIFNLISRIYSPTSGRIYFEDQDITQQPAFDIAKLGIARTFQNIELFENATVLSNLLVGRHRHSTTQALAGSAVHAERAQRREGPSPPRRAGHRISRSRALPRQADLGAALRRAKGDRACPRAVHRAEADPARRAVVRIERRGDRRHVVLDPRHEDRTRHHRADGRARHDAGEPGIRPGHRAELRQGAGDADRRPKSRSIPTSSPPISAPEDDVMNAPATTLPTSS